ncbi:MAG: oligosaccharide flippase family protein [Actinomycetota bacterium]|nr:oligosaccharide flippase family protein [Actinomycetota bacterium]
MSRSRPRSSERKPFEADGWTVKAAPDRTTRFVFWTGASVAAAQAIAAVIGLVSAHALGAEGRGIVSGLTTWSAMLAFVTLAGLQSAASVAVATNPQRALSSVLGNALAYVVVIGGTVMLVALVFLPDLLSKLGPGARRVIPLALLSVPVCLAFEVLASVNIALDRVRQYGLARLVGPGVVLAVVLALWFTGAMTPGWVVGLTTFGAFLGTVVLALGLPWRRVRLDLAALGHDLRFGLRTHLGTLMGMANLRLDVMVMAAILTATQVGLYSVATSAMIPIEALSVAGALHVLPAVARLGPASAAEQTVVRSQLDYIRRTARTHVAMAAVVGLGVFVCAPLIVGLLGPSFHDAVGPLRVLVAGYVARGCSLVVNAGAIGMGRAWVANAAEGAALLTTLVMLPVLLPKHGALGAAITSSCAYTLSALVGAALLYHLGRSWQHGHGSGAASALRPIQP